MKEYLKKDLKMFQNYIMILVHIIFKTSNLLKRREIGKTTYTYLNRFNSVDIIHQTLKS